MINWLQRNRTSVRLAFILRLFGMAAGSLMSLVWYRLLLRSMGDPLYGLFLSFQGLTRLGGLGDLGISGAISLKAGMLLGRGEEDALRRLLASARALFLFLAGLLFIGFLALSPWLPGWLNFQGVPGVGSLPLLFMIGGVSVAILILAGYWNSLNFAIGTVTWPIVPAVLIGQFLAPCGHWLLARQGAPLWAQNLPYAVAILLLAWLGWWMLKWSHPWLAELRPLAFDPARWRELAAASGWVYLCTLGSAIYHITDRLVIVAGFGPAIVPTYLANYKVCELAFILITGASYVSLPKITQWISSPEAVVRHRGMFEARRLNTFQITLGCAAALGYLAFNDLFIRLWLGADYQAPLAWQAAFACNLAVSTGGDSGIQIATRCGDKGIRTAGLAVAATGLLNLVLSILSLRFGSITGIALATVIAQSVLSLGLGWYTCRYLGLSATGWAAKSWVLPLAIVLLAALVKAGLPGYSFSHIGILSGAYAALILAASRLAGVNLETLQAELEMLRSMLKR